MKHIRITIAICLLAVLLGACAGDGGTNADSLEGTTWVLVRYNDTPPIEGTQPTITFEEGQVSGTASCNHYGGSYEVKGDSIRFEALFSTEMACMEPEGVMEQERAYLEMLGAAERFELADGALTIYAGSLGTLTFGTEVSTTASPTSTPAQVSIAAATPTAEVFAPAAVTAFVPPEGFKEYQDATAGVSIYIPENWVVTGVIEGEYAIFQSYPLDKYVGGEARQPGDTKCDLNIRPSGITVTDLVEDWKADPSSTILSQEEVSLGSGQPGMRLEVESMGTSISMVSRVAERVVVLTCFGEPAPFDEIAYTLRGE